MKRFFKKIICFIVVLSLIVMIPSQATEREVTRYNGELIMFTVANDTLLELTYSSMPVVKNGIVYVPYTFFTNNFDIRTVYEPSTRALMYGSFGKILTFDFKNEVTYDTSMNAIPHTGIYVKNQPFVPAEFVATYFGLNYSFIGYGPIVRIYNDSISYPDSFLATTFKSRMSEMKTSLVNSTTEEDPVIPPPQGGNNNQEEDPPVEVIPIIDVFTAFTVDRDGNTDLVLDTLANVGIRSAFFVKSSDIINCEELIRRISFEDHTLGILIDPESKDILKDIEEANSLLKKILKMKTNLLVMPVTESKDYFTDDIRETLKSSGYRYWESNITYKQDKKGNIEGSVLDALSDDENAKFMLLDDSIEVTAELDSILNKIKHGNFSIDQIDIYSMPINSYGDLW